MGVVVSKWLDLQKVFGNVLKNDTPFKFMMIYHGNPILLNEDYFSKLDYKENLKGET